MWFPRKFAPVDAALLPNLIERLRGTPARLEERLRDVPTARLVQRHGETWSIQENVGHLLDLEPLWRGRVDDFTAGATTLRATDVENRATWAAEHNRQPLATILDRFRAARMELVRALTALPADLRTREALHPRLRTPMQPADLAFFTAEHDDHHLARLTELLARG